MRTNRTSGSLVRMRRLFVVIALVLSALSLAPIHAATGVLYVTATGHYMRGVFRDFWDKNGGLPNFGYPLTEEYVDAQTGRIYQYYERARFERAQASSTTVQLGLIGREVLGNRTFATAQPIANSAQRRYFSETRHIVQYGFKETWETRGGLPIFGLPLSEEIEEQLADGQVHTIQFFERARFEYWPNLPPGQRVLLGALGRQLAPSALTPPLAPGAPPAGPITVTPPAPPSLARPIIPDSKNARVTPQAGQPGQTFVFEATGFQGGERVSLWVNVPDGSVVGANSQVTADAQGAITAGKVQYTSDSKAPLGVWSIVGQGTASGRTAIGYFRLLGSAIARAPQPGPGVPPNVDARADPPAGPAGTIFFFDAFGFRSGEEVQMTIVASDGKRTTADFTVPADANGSIGYAGIYYVTAPGYPLGLYSFIAQGKSSNKVSTAYFVLMP
jgi:hypothetical protein